ASPHSTSPLGIIQAPASLFFQNGPPGLISRTWRSPSRVRNRRMPALCGGGIHVALLGRNCFGDPAPAEQARTVIDDRRLTGGDPIFLTFEPEPFAVARGGNRGGERAHLDADLALLLADPVPIRDAHCLNGKRSPRPDDDPPLLRLDTDDVQRLGHAADLDPAPLPNGEMHDAA